MMALVLVGLWLVRARSRREGQTILAQATAGHPGADMATRQIPAGLLVTEWAIGRDGERTLLQDRKGLAYSPQVPLTFGEDATRSAFVLRMPGAPPRHMVLRLDGRGGATLIPANGEVRVDGNVVERPLFLVADERHVIAVGAVELQIEPANVRPESEEALFQRLQDVSQTTVQPSAPQAQAELDNGATPTRHRGMVA